MAAHKAITQEDLLRLFATAGGRWLARGDIFPTTQVSRSTISRRLAEAVTAGRLEDRGSGAGRRYRLPDVAASADLVLPMLEIQARGTTGPRWSKHSSALRRYVQQPRATRVPVSYQEALVGNYTPNETFFLPAKLRAQLNGAGRSSGERPAGTYARDILGQLLIDLSWASSRLEGNRYSRLETKNLIEAGTSVDGKTRQEAVMILNHKQAIEFLVDAAAHDEPYYRVVANLHSLLMDGLLHDQRGLGAIRQRLVVIADSVYTPWQMPAELERMYRILCDKAERITDPLECAFFLFTQLPYLQPFADGNKRTSRVACNLPLAKANFAPLAFLDVDDADYFSALMALYEKADLSVAVDLFEWAYLRSVANYAVVKQAMGEPDAFRTRLRQELSTAVKQVVANRLTPEHAVAGLHLAVADDSEQLVALVEHELAGLTELNYARYGLTFGQYDAWQNTH